MALTTAVMVWIFVFSDSVFPLVAVLFTFDCLGLMIFISGQVGEANDLLPDIAAKAANLKVFQFRGVVINSCEEDYVFLVQGWARS